MSQIFEDRLLTVLNCDVLEGLRTLPDSSVQSVVTSPPYWGLRDYGIDPTEWPAVEFAPMANLPPIIVPGQSCCHGLEMDPVSFVAHEVAIFREVRRVLRNDGTLWLNLGDCYADGGKGGGGAYMNERGEKAWGPRAGLNGWRPPMGGLKHKDACGIPWRVAFALQADGWYLRSEIIWAKPNPMPESCSDRPTKAHEYLFLLTKRPRYYWDADAVKEPCSSETHARIPQSAERSIQRSRDEGASISDSNPEGHGVNPKARELQFGVRSTSSFKACADLNVLTRNIRSVWSVASEPIGYRHFAAFPSRIPERCILAGTSVIGCCSLCGAPWRRNTRPGTRISSGGSSRKHAQVREHQGANGVLTTGVYSTRETIGWTAGCECCADSVPCTVLDPFAGSGTTGLAANRLGRRAVLIEKSSQYCQIIRQRTRETGLAL